MKSGSDPELIGRPRLDSITGRCKQLLNRPNPAFGYRSVADSDPPEGLAPTGGKILPLDFFARPAEKVAHDLIGKTLRCKRGSATLSLGITETEAYLGQHDLACHSAKGRTARTEVMFGPAGRFYIYRIYGLHWMLNIVTGAVEEGAAVLIRGVEGIDGPGRVAAALGIDASLGGMEAIPACGLWFEEPGEAKRLRVMRTPRIGIDYAGPVWAARKLRFVKHATESGRSRKGAR